MNRRIWNLIIPIALLLTACSRPELNIDFEKYTLDNGLEVVLHEDRSDQVTDAALLQ